MTAREQMASRYRKWQADNPVQGPKERFDDYCNREHPVDARTLEQHETDIGDDMAERGL